MIKQKFRCTSVLYSKHTWAALTIARGELLRMYSLVNLNILQVLAES